MASRRGAEFERKVRDLFTRHGYVVVRSTVSKSPADLVALRGQRGADLYAPFSDHPSPLVVRSLLIQAKIGGRHRFSPADWNELYSLAISSGSWAVLAAQEKQGRRHVVALYLLCGPRQPYSREWPMKPLEFVEVGDATQAG